MSLLRENSSITTSIASTINNESSRHDSSSNKLSIENGGKNKANNFENEEIENCEESIEKIKNYCKNYIIDSKYTSFFKLDNDQVNDIHQNKNINQSSNNSYFVDPPIMHQQQHHAMPSFASKLNHHHHHHHHNANFTPPRPVSSYNPHEMIYTTAVASKSHPIQPAPMPHPTAGTEYVSIRYFAPVQKIANKGEQTKENNLNSSNFNILDKKIQPTFLPHFYSNELLQQYKLIGIGSSNNHLTSYDRPISSLWNLTGGDSNNSSTLYRNYNRSLGIDTKSANNFINRSPLYGARKGGAGNYNELLDLTPKDQDFKRFLKIGLITAFVSVLIVVVVIGSVLGATLTSTNPLSRSSFNDKNILRSSIINENGTASNVTNVAPDIKESLSIDANNTNDIFTTSVMTKPRIKTIFNKTFILKPKLKPTTNLSTITKKLGISTAVLSSIFQEDNLLQNNSTENNKPNTASLATINIKTTIPDEVSPSTKINTIISSSSKISIFKSATTMLNTFSSSNITIETPKQEKFQTNLTNITNQNTLPFKSSSLSTTSYQQPSTISKLTSP